MQRHGGGLDEEGREGGGAGWIWARHPSGLLRRAGGGRFGRSGRRAFSSDVEVGAADRSGRGSRRPFSGELEVARPAMREEAPATGKARKETVEAMAGEVNSNEILRVFR